jgi:glutamate synthase (NADPH) small chain
MEDSVNKPAPKAGRTPRQSMPEQSARRRVSNFQEVPKGYLPETAIAEALRCLQCKKPFCVDGCPVNIDIPAFVKLIAEGKFPEAAMKLKEQTALPAVCGRVCPQETQCEERCVLGKKFKQIGRAHV